MWRVPALTVALLVLAAAPAGAATRNVAIGDFRYAPDHVRVEPGDTVTWTNRGDVLHTVTTRRGAPEGFGSGNLDSGQVFSRTLARPGTYGYVCTLHPGLMDGVVQVGPDRVKPKVSSLRARSGRRTVVAFRLSERSRVTIRLTRGGRTVQTVRPKGRPDGFVTQTVKRPAAGRYRVVLTATDVEGNRTVARTTLRVR